jgi:transposase
MQQLFERVAGLDVHRQTVAVCVRVPGAAGERAQHIRMFGTTSRRLGRPARLVGSVSGDPGRHGEHRRVLEPVYYVLEETMTCLLVNAQHVQKVPGRKTDVQDCVWLAQLLEHGLLRGSFVPPPPLRELRDLTRYRKVLIQERTREANRLHKVLEDAGIKLATVATDILGASGRDMLHALVAGTTDPEVLADLARGTLRKKLPALRQALAGRFRAHHAFMVSQHFGHLDYFDEAIAALSTRIEEALRPFRGRTSAWMASPASARAPPRYSSRRSA